MPRLRGIFSLLAIAGIFFLAARALHLLVPLFYPAVLSGPFSVEEPEEVARYAGFSPLMPFYRPESLGRRPVHITAERRPRPRVTVFWNGARFLVLEEVLDGGRPPRSHQVPPGALPFPALEDGARWREGRTLHAAGRRGEVWVEIRTDLGEADLVRIAETLRPVEELR
jgi:hypothetical protein